MNAAFVHEMFPRQVLGFVDESEAKRKKPFRELPVRHPADLGSDDAIVFPPGMSEALIDRVDCETACKVRRVQLMP